MEAYNEAIKSQTQQDVHPCMLQKMKWVVLYLFSCLAWTAGGFGGGPIVNILWLQLQNKYLFHFHAAGQET